MLDRLDICFTKERKESKLNPRIRARVYGRIGYVEGDRMMVLDSHLISCHLMPQWARQSLWLRISRNLSFNIQVSETVTLDFFPFATDQVICMSLPSEAVRYLVNAFVISRIDYRTGPYTNLPRIQLNRRQSISNVTAKLIICPSKYSHITPLL